ncbi:MAG: diaminopimelate decarboxylase [Candidatus Omnitrophota bacterium]
MHEFRFKNNILHAEDVPVDKIVSSAGTPCFIYSYNTLISHFEKIKRAFREINPLVCYSVKANSNLAVLKTLVNQGAGLDIVSGGELYRALKTRVSPQKIVYAGVGKSIEEIKYSINSDILMFNVESIPELRQIELCARRLKKKVRVALRVNPNVDVHTHKYITTGKSENKFGIDLNMARDIFLARKKQYLSLTIAGIHMHIGSQLVRRTPFVRAISKICRFIEELKSRCIVELEYLNIGGGLGIIYKNEQPQTADEYAKTIIPMLKKTKLKIILEPGRFIAGNSGILVTRVQYVKKTKQKTFIIVDAAMNDLVRPSLYSAYHEILPVVKKKSGNVGRKADIVGPVCESGDFFAKDRQVTELTIGDLLAIMSAGAYGFSMSSNYNSRLRACEVMVRGNQFFVIRRRERYSDLVTGENIPSWLK